jgi:subtilisin family serine protease
LILNELLVTLSFSRAGRAAAWLSAVLALTIAQSLAIFEPSFAADRVARTAPPKPRKVPRPRSNSLEYRLSWGLGAIRADRAYARGLDGRGITVAMIDTGMTAASMGLFPNASPDSIDLVGKRLALLERDHHGEQTAAILAAPLDGRGTVGVAYGASLLSVRIDVDGSCTTQCYAYASDLARGIDYALDHGARIIGVPLVGSNKLKGLEPVLTRVAAAGAVVVAAAGNAGAEDAAWPARNAADPRFRQAIIVAGASDMRGELASWSNRSGEAADRYLLAPGENILVNCDRRTCQLVSGTSYSVPYVAGALSLVMAAQANRTAQEAARILLRAAEDRGAPGIDVATGVGLVNLDRALAIGGRMPT